MQPQGTVFYHFYRMVAALAAPVIWLRVSRKLARAGVPAARQRERLGHATLPRPEGRLFWFHAASVGESLSVLALARRMMEREPGAEVLITSGTASSAEILDKRMPAGCRHQFAPLDRRDALSRFLGHWRPDAAIFVESELWPQMLVATHRAGVPLALLNARMSAATLKNWGRFDATARFLLGLFTLIRTQDQRTLDGMLALGADPDRVARGPNLKAMSDPLPVDERAYMEMEDAVSGLLWVAASTHPGEEAQVIEAHLKLRETVRDARLILVPRHPERAEEVAALVRAQGLSVVRRSVQRDPDGADVYIADTLGEMGLWYQLAPVVFLGGSLGRAGGHNPFEPAQMNCALISGRKVANFADVYAAFAEAGAVRMVKNARELAEAVAVLLTDPEEQQAQKSVAASLARSRLSELDDLADLLLTGLAEDAA
ncbi:3-deoxy-D-manno-octulosonic acid transferase [Primorskyibacter flagellatus]|uniref:3-deoxy-D-manno-octulosonic acid transferase n=1 Tax=Primorskyibacter flagellatus TaxID=1387277 RepID=A0A917A748_9RHOB|nr:3-deoxy-D-manno-octulosonic acid transferase [Primorskyibacter flagellatus]GGE31606.1 3-deoxy-D-manno-octulosonic acid transferase [Primorskyibacter flagellatus]